KEDHCAPIDHPTGGTRAMPAPHRFAACLHREESWCEPMSCLVPGRLHIRRPVGGAAMARVVVSEFLSVDGVLQSPGYPDEDPSGGFEHGGWQQPLFDG